MSLESSGKREPEQLSRRRFIIEALAVVAAGIPLIADLEKETVENDKRLAELKAKDTKEKPITFLTLEKAPRRYDTSPVAGMKLGAPLSDYFGTTQFGKETDIDFKYQLAQLWKKKLEKKAPTEIQRPYYLQAFETIVAGYHPDHADQSDVEHYAEEIDIALNRANNALDWKKISHAFKLNASAEKLFESYTQVIDSDTLTAISMAELMPAGDGKRNVALMQTLLQTGGTEFLRRVPSSGDTLLSLGAYQHTPAVVFDNGKDRGSASFMARFSKIRLLPDTVLHLDSSQHHIAAYLNALYNLAQTLRTLNEGQAKKLLPNTSVLADDIRQFVIASHHRPADAREAFSRFAPAYLIAKSHSGAAPHFAAFTRERTAEYLKKGSANLEALRALS